MDALDLLGGDAQAFLDDVWATRAHIHKADIDRLVALLALDDVDALLTSTALRTPALRIAQDGKVLTASSYTRQATIAGEQLTGLVDVRKVVALFEGGATLVLQGLHRYWPPLTQLIRSLERGLGHPCQANAYLTPAGAQGFALHSDAHDVFVFQTHGAKQWEVHDRGSQLDVLMEVGTCMYLPAGTPHAARTQDTASLHVTVGVNQVSYREALRGVVDTVLDDPRYSGRLPAAYLDDPETLASGFATRLTSLADTLAGLEPLALASQHATSFLSSRRTELRGALQDILSIETIDDDTILQRRPGAFCVVDPCGDSSTRVTLLLGDRQLHLPSWLADVAAHVAALPADAILRPADLAPWLERQSRVVLSRRLVREGLLKVAG
ncbi:MAG: cupin domain-containing protein [Nocardioidaceae bacterium]